MYYLRTRAAADAIKFTVDTSIIEVQVLMPICPFALFLLCVLDLIYNIIYY